jgi:alpha-beta hydrolase superfamily lysophospholipase
MPVVMRDGLRLAVEHHAISEARADVLIVHGFGEHKGRYHHVAAALNAASYGCHLFDLRGHGASDGTRAYVEAFRDFTGDVDRVVERIRAGRRPVVIFGHSLGGLIALQHVIHRPATFDALVVSSPFLATALPVSSLERLAGRLLARLSPTLTFGARVQPRWLSHDASVVEAYVRDPLVLHRITVRLWREIDAAQREALERAAEVRLPTLFLVASDDRVVDVATTRELFARVGSPDKRYLAYDGYFHEVLNEEGGQRTLDDLMRWLDERFPAGAAGS